MILNKDSKNKTWIFSNTVRLIFKHSLPLLLGQCIFIAIAVFMIMPFTHYILNFARSISGFSYVTINNLLSFLVNPFTLLAMVFLFFLTGFFLLYETAFFITFYSVIENGNSPKLLFIFYLSLKKVVLILLRKNFKLLPFVWLTVLFYNIPLIIYFVKNAAFFRYATKHITLLPYIKLFFLVLFIILLLFMLRRLFVFQYCLFESKNYKNACKLSKKIRKTRAIRAICYFVGWNIAIGVLAYIIRIIVMVVSALLVTGFAEHNIAVATFISINEKTSNYLVIAIFSISMIANFALFTHLFYQYKKEENEFFYFDNSVETVFLKLKSYKKIILIFCAAFAVTSIYLAYDIIKNDAPFLYVDFDMIKITSHRGFSKDVPENTIPAIEKSMEEQADYIEIDVRQTKDGELVLLHDENLRRTTGLNKSIWSVTYAEVSNLDAGKWLDEAYAGTKIPTLREVFDLCKGKVNINMDLKYDKHVDGLGESVTALIEEYEMENQCVISSSDLTLLEQVKSLNSKIRTGYITYRIEPNYYDNKNIDFFSLNSYFISENLLQAVHEHGKEIHVWTVNTRHELERMKNLGVDNIITDNPSFAKQVLYQDKSNRLLVTLFRLMITY